MNYPQSEQILGKIRAAKEIFITCHAHPDADSAGSALALHLALMHLDISSTVVGVDTLDSIFQFLPKVSTIKQIDLANYSLPADSLVCLLDVGDWGMLLGKKPEIDPSFDFIRIDHHKASSIESDISIVETERSSTAEILYLLFEDWNVPISADIATCLLTGIIGDTGSFQYDLTQASTHTIAGELYKYGADHDLIFHNLFRSMKFSSYKLLELFLKNFTFDEEHSFVWTAVSFEEYTTLKNPEKTPFVDIIIQTVADSNFGIRFLEKEKGVITMSLRSRFPKTIDISLLAKKFGGGGHVAASGARIEGDYSSVVANVLEETRKFAKSL